MLGTVLLTTIAMLRVFISFVVLTAAYKPEAIYFPKEWNAIVGGRTALAPPEDDPVAYVTVNGLWARVAGLREGRYPNSYYRFLGLRYAIPPVGVLRFQRPRPFKLEGDVLARKFGAHCPQPHPDDPSKVTGSEDCLFLNVFTPKLPDSEPLLPVLVWIHGGGFRRGSGAQYGGGYLARRDLVVVTVNYRLGTLGFLTTSDPNLSGNAAMFDLAAALNWVKDNIEFFGGDPHNIIPFGQGTGGSSAALIAISNITQGRIAGVISMSGTATSPFATDSDPKYVVKTLAEENGCPASPSVAMVKCFQQLPYEKLVQSDTKIEKIRVTTGGLSGMAAALSPAPVLEPEPDQRALPPYLDEAPGIALERNHGARIPLLTGVVSHETAAAVAGGYRSKILDSLKNIPNFLESVLVKDLTQQVQAGANALTKVFNTVSTNYKNIKPKSVADGLNQVIEVTSDALFNFPAFQQSSAWVKRKLPTFFYSFEHSGRLRGAAKVLKGSPLVFESNQIGEIKAVSHGSDLPYIFDLRSLEGMSDPEQNETTPLHPDDQATRDTFLSLLEQFAKKGSIEVDKKKFSFPTYVSIDKTARLGASFRECNMALWSGKQPKETCPTIQLLTSQIVQGLTNAYSGAQSALNKLPETVWNVSLPQKPPLNLPILGFGN